MPVQKIAVGVLGATGTVGQRFIELLDSHPQFYVKALGASERSSGKMYSEACNWKMSNPMPSTASKMIVQICEPEPFKDCKIIFSGLDAAWGYQHLISEIEMNFLLADFAVFSNAKNHRMNCFVPLIVPLVNSDHFDVIPNQRKHFRVRNGFLVTNANCSTTGLVVALKPLQDAFGPLSKVLASYLWCGVIVSKIRYPGVASLDILGNVVPFISGEEEKIEIEVKKILGCVNYEATGFTVDESMKVSASCNRVPVIDGHTETVFIEFSRKPAPSEEDIKHVLESYLCEANARNVFSVPSHPIVCMSQNDRPQPRLDLHQGNGNSVVIGRIRKCNVFDIKFTLLAHNTILGAAGSSIMNAEIAVSRGLIQ